MSERDEKKYRPRRFREDNSVEIVSDIKEPAEDTEAPSDISASGAAAPDAAESSRLKYKDVAIVDEYPDEAEGFDYIIPEKSYKESQKQHRHKHKHKHRSSSDPGKAADDGAEKDSSDDYVFAVPKKKKHHHHHHHHHHHKSRRKRRMKRWKKILLIILCVILVIVIALVGTFFILREIGRRSMHNYDDLQVIVPTEVESGKEVVSVDKYGRVINYDGVSYAFNDSVLALTLIGVDEGTGSDSGEKMADAIYIFTVDTSSGKVRVLGISRDTMTDVDIYSDSGSYIDTENRQITYSYAYSGDGVNGAENTNKSLSRLFYGLPMKDYAAINMDALKYLNDAIGGVTLTSSMTFVSSEDGRTINEGETVTLHGGEAETYVRSRDTEVLSSNNDRMKRQQEYIRAFLSSIIPAAKKDISVVGNLYSAISDNTESSLDVPKITYIASTALSFLKSASDIEYLSLKGEITAGEHAELRPTDEEILKTMLEVFYKPIAKLPVATEKAETLPAGTQPEETRVPVTKPAQ